VQPLAGRVATPPAGANRKSLARRRLCVTAAELAAAGRRVVCPLGGASLRGCPGRSAERLLSSRVTVGQRGGLLECCGHLQEELGQRQLRPTPAISWILGLWVHV
jgi:hypothetical protein